MSYRRRQKTPSGRCVDWSLGQQYTRIGRSLPAIQEDRGKCEEGIEVHREVSANLQVVLQSLHAAEACLQMEMTNETLTSELRIQ